MYSPVMRIYPTPVFEPRPVPQPRPTPQPAPDPKYLEFKNLFESNNNYLRGEKIPHKYRHSTKIESIKNPKIFIGDVEGEPIKTNISKTYEFIPPELLNSQEFLQLLRLPRNRELLRTQKFHSLLSKNKFIQPPLTSKPFSRVIPDSQQFSKIPPSINYTPTPKSTKSRDPFLHELSSFTKITSDNKEVVKMEIEPAIPDASYFRSPSMIYTLVFLTIFTIISTFYLFSKYTPLGLLFSKKKRKKRQKRQLDIKKIQEESPSFDKITNYSVNDMPYENKTHDDNNIYTKIKIQKSIINKNISLPKKKKNNRKAIIDIHMELLNEYKNDEWELNKNDFLQICLEEFIREQNKIYSNSENTNLVMKNISIQNTKEDKMVLLDKWTERCRPIWEKFKSENAFKVLQYGWKKEEKKYLENIEQFENNILNENTKISYKEIKKEIWRRWMTKQAKFIGQFTQEKWFKSLVKQIEDVSDEYKIGEIKDDIFVLNIVSHIVTLTIKENIIYK
ncbi:STP1 protein [Plasmodium ovale wallikeri]|uniref:STP1 protein n=1 Tax=Plasmodium ovale wallikeri TaxID=864142 RepID=A0A1A9AKM0_PLAOA|nr:STP1 protein [Plasmodium ovale wallikeri]